MQEKIALITGGMGGIGESIAQYLASNGAKVAVTYNKNGNHATAAKWQKEQKEKGYDFSIHFTDVSNYNSVTDMVNEVINQYGKIDILVNNAGITEDITLLKMSPEQWDRVVNTNLNGTFNVTKSILKYMIENQYGRIINISSINGQKGQFGQTNYCATKAGLHGFTKALAIEVAKRGITVNTVSPGHVKTAMLDDIPPEILNKIIAAIPVGRLAEPIEVARVVGFLSSKEAGYITGSNISINGGQHMY